MSPRMFCHHGRFVATDVLTPDVLALRMLCDERFATGRFVTGRFVGESQKGLAYLFELHTIQYNTILFDDLT